MFVFNVDIKRKVTPEIWNFRTQGKIIAHHGERMDWMYVVGNNSVGRVKVPLEREIGGKETN